MEMKYGILFALLLVLPLVNAVPQGKGALGSAHLDGAMADVNCKSEFTVGFLNAMETAVPGSATTLGPIADKLTSDTATLQGYAISGDSDAYRTF